MQAPSSWSAAVWRRWQHATLRAVLSAPALRVTQTRPPGGRGLTSGNGDTKCPHTNTALLFYSFHGTLRVRSWACHRNEASLRRHCDQLGYAHAFAYVHAMGLVGGRYSKPRSWKLHSAYALARCAMFNWRWMQLVVAERHMVHTRWRAIS